MGELIKYYEDETVTIYHGTAYDCKEIILAADVMITDPPYEVATSGGGIGRRRQYLKDINGADIDKGFNIEILNWSENVICFCSRMQLRKMLELFDGDTWALLLSRKSNPTPLINNNYLPCTEYIFHRWTTGNLYGEYRDRFRHKVTTVNKNGHNHPTVKPLEVMRWLVAVGSDVGQTVIDPFCGSGSTLVACKEMGRKSIGIEIEEKYREIAANRCRQGVLFT